MTAGVAQSSVLGPDLWNIYYYGILMLELADGCFMIAYADDIVLVIIVRNVQQAQHSLSICMLNTSIWMEVHGLSLAAAKTEIVIFTRKQIDTVVPIRIDENNVIETKSFVKYLGIILDTKLNYWEQVDFLVKVGVLVIFVANLILFLFFVSSMMLFLDCFGRIGST